MQNTQNNKIFNLFPNAQPNVNDKLGGGFMQIEKVNDFQVELQKYSNQVDAALKHANSVSISDDNDAKTSVELAGELRKLSKKIEATKKEITGPAREFINKVNGMANVFTEKLDDAITVLSSKVGKYNSDKELEQLAHAEELRILELATGSSVSLEVAPMRTNTKADNASTYQTTEWEIEVIDIEKVPYQFLIIDEPMVKAALKAGKGEIPGLKIVEKKVTRIRSK